jgi:hypothetical protein
VAGSFLIAISVTFPLFLLARERKLASQDAALSGQQASVRMASRRKPGAIAQLEERRHGMAEVVGSSPTSSILIAADRTAVAARPRTAFTAAQLYSTHNVVACRA